MKFTITPPFYVDEYYNIRDNDSAAVVLMPSELANHGFPKTLCRIMNENANALVHAANGEEATA